MATMRIVLLVLCLALVPALLGRAADANAAHRAAAVDLSSRLRFNSRSSVQQDLGAPDEKPVAGGPVTADTTPSTVSLHQHVGDSGSSQHGHATSGDAVGGQVAFVQSSSVNEATSSEGKRTASTDSDGSNESSHGHGHSSSDSGN